MQRETICFCYYYYYLYIYMPSICALCIFYAFLSLQKTLPHPSLLFLTIQQRTCCLQQLVGSLTKFITFFWTFLCFYQPKLQTIWDHKMKDLFFHFFFTILLVLSPSCHVSDSCEGMPRQCICQEATIAHLCKRAGVA